MKIKNLENISLDQLNFELKNGAKFIVFPFCVSIGFMSFNRASGVHFVKQGESTLRPALLYSLISFIVGWWGIPWGPIWTVHSIYKNLSGGKDMTKEILIALNTSSEQTK